MQAQPVPASRGRSATSSWRLTSVGRSVLPVMAMLLLATATAFGAWLLLFVIDLGCRWFTSAS